MQDDPQSSSQTTHSVDALKKYLGSTYVLYMKTQNYHWHVKGMHFFTLHQLFQSQYEELAQAIDTIAERITILGQRAPSTLKEMLENSFLKEEDQELKEKQMLESLVNDHKKCLEFLQTKRPLDPVTEDLFIERMDVHGKSIWILSSHLEK